MGNYIEERRYLPTGMAPDDYDAHAFSLEVIYRGYGKWSVGQGSHRQMTHKGNLLWMPRRMTQRRWCRFSFADACALAEAHVDDLKVNGLTYAEWESRKAARSCP